MSLKDMILKKGIRFKITVGKIFNPRNQKRTTPNEDFLKKGKAIKDLVEKGRKAKDEL